MIQDRWLPAGNCFDNRHQGFLNSRGLPGELLAKIYADNAFKLVSGDQ